MKKAERVARVLEAVDTLFPDAECELIHHNAFELLIAVVLSAAWKTALEKNSYIR